VGKIVFFDVSVRAVKLRGRDSVFARVLLPAALGLLAALIGSLGSPFDSNEIRNLNPF